MSTTRPAAHNVCAYSQIRNVSGKSVHFSYLGHHGVTLNHGQDWYEVGDVWSWLAAAHPGIKGRRMIKQFRDDIENERIQLVEAAAVTCGRGAQFEAGSSSSSSTGTWFKW